MKTHLPGLRPRSLAIVFCLLLLSGMVAVSSLGAQATLLPGPVSPGAPSGRASPFTLAAWPSFTLPLGTEADTFLLAAGGGLSGELPLAFLPGLSAHLNAGYSSLQIKSLLTAGTGIKDSIGEIGGQLGASYTIPISSWLNARVLVSGGLAYGGLGSDFANGNAYGLVEGGAGLGLIFDPSLSLHLDASYLYRFGLFGGINARLSLAWALPAASAAGPAVRPRLLDYTELKFANIYPIFQSYYDEHPLGTVRITNTGKEAARDLKVSFLIRQYMDGPKECATIPELKPGEYRDVPLLALFRNNILDVTEATKATGEIILDYRDSVDAITQTKTASVQVQNRNAMTWDDDQKAAAFVSSKDPWVLDLSNNIIAAVRGQRNEAINAKLQTAIAFHAALRQYGLSYVTNPKTPFAEVMANPEIIDFLKFPRQTLNYKAGNCSDLTILYASFFEAVGVETAFVTVPGHIFLAINLDIAPNQATQNIANAGDLIFRDNKTWLPLETTMRDGSLAEIWAEAAREWRQGTSTANAGFLPVHDAWKVYAPVGLPADNTSPDALNQAKLATSFAAELNQIVDRDLAKRLTVVNADIKENGESAKLLNQRGVVYARFGQLDLAGKDFAAASKKAADFTPALVNLGNIALLKKDNKAAYEAFAKAAKLNPGNVAIAACRDKAAGLAGIVPATPAADQTGGAAVASVATGETGTRAAEVVVSADWMEE